MSTTQLDPTDDGRAGLRDPEQARLHAQIEQLTTAVQSNRAIGEALGLIMAEYRMNHDAAWDVLRRLSQTHHRKLIDVATDIVGDHHRSLP